MNLTEKFTAIKDKKCRGCNKTNTRLHCEASGCDLIVCRDCKSYGIPGTDKWHTPKNIER